MALIKTVEQLKETVKIGKSAPFEAIIPFVEDAQRFYIEPYTGITLIKRMEENPDEDAKKLLIQVNRALGPFSYMLATHEASIEFGDAGHTVSRTERVTPASDMKIKLAQESAEFRAWQNLEYLLEYLEANKGMFPEWEQSRYRKTGQPKYFRSAVEFQSLGMVNIDNSRLTYEKLIDLIRRIERTEIRPLITPKLDDRIENPFSDTLPTLEYNLVSAIQPYIASRVAAIHTSQTTHQQRSESGRPEYRPVIRPLYEDLEDTGNYYAGQVNYWKDEIISLLDGLGVDKTGALKWNTEDKKLFCDIG